MKSSKPPILASWLVEHLIPGAKRDALAGDLLEQFSQGRSAAWYWCQALVAILVGFSKELRILWMAVAFTVLWNAQFFGPRFWTVFIWPQFRAFFTWGLHFPWPVPLITTTGFFTAVHALPILVALNIHLGVTRSFSLRRLSRGMFVGLLALALGVFLALGAAMLRLLHVLHLDGLEQAFWAVLSEPVAAYTIAYLAYLPLFFGLLLSMWAARPNNAFRGTTRISL